MLEHIDLCQWQVTSLRGDSSKRRRRKRRFSKNTLLNVILFANILFLAHSSSSIFSETVAANLSQVNAQLQHLSVASAIYSSTQSTPLLARKKRKGVEDLGRPQIAKKYFVSHGQDGREYERAKISDFLKENPMLLSLNMFQADGEPSSHDSNVIDITSPNLNNTEWKNTEVIVRQSEIPKNKHPLLSKRQGLSASSLGIDKPIHGIKLRSDEDVLRTFGTLVPKVTSWKVDNFNEIYQFFNNTYFGSANLENSTEKVPYPLLPSRKTTKAKTEHISLKSILSTTTSTKKDSLDYTATITPLSPNSRGSSMRDYFNAFILDRQKYWHANSSEDQSGSFDSSKVNELGDVMGNLWPSEQNSKPEAAHLKNNAEISSSNAIELSDSTMNSAEEQKMSEFIYNSTPSFGRRYAPRLFSADDITRNESLGVSVENVKNSTTQPPFEVTPSLELALTVGETPDITKSTSPPPTSTTSVYYAVRDEGEISEEVHYNASDYSTNLRPWERKRGENHKPSVTGNFKGTDDFIPIANVAARYVGDEVKMNGEITSSKYKVDNRNGTEDDSNNNAFVGVNHQEVLIEPYTTSQMRTEESNDIGTEVRSNEELSTLVPFPPIMPGGQFYVDQHISYGQFGRADVSGPAQNVVYDPNVLESRYGFSGILPGTVPESQFASSAQPPIKSLSNAFAESPYITSFPSPPPLFASKTFPYKLPENSNFVGETPEAERPSSRLAKLQTKGMRKPTTFGVQNVPIVLHRIIPPTNFSNNTKDQELNVLSRPSNAVGNAFASGAAYFFIPKSRKLDTSKIVKLRAHGQASLIPTSGSDGSNPVNSQSLFSFLNENKKVARLLDGNVSKGLVADTNITDSRRRTLLNRLNSSPNLSSTSPPLLMTIITSNSNMSTTTNVPQPLFAGGNSADRTLVKYEADANGNPLNWRPFSGSGSLAGIAPSRLEKETLPSIRLVPLPDLLPPLKGKIKEATADKAIAGNSNFEYESINEFDPSVTPMCHESDDSNTLTGFSPRLIPAIQKCFRRSTNCILQQAKPLERRINFSEEQCISFCGSHSYCISITYSKSLQICDVYNVRNGTGSARLYLHKDFHYYETRRKSLIEENSSADCWKENAPYTDVIASAENQLAILVDSHDSSALPPTGESARADFAPSGNVAHSSTAVNAPRDTCPGDRDIIVFKSTGYRLLNPLVDLPGLLVDEELSGSMNVNSSSGLETPFEQISSETECIFSCLINLARGSTPYECMAATFNVGERRCLLYFAGNNLNGNIHLIPDVENNHYEKGCISMDLVKLCKGYPIIRHAQKTLLGFAMVSRFAASFVECIEICFADRQNAHRQNAKELKNRRYCKSVMYFYEETSSKNCILNSENRESAPAFFVDENEALVDYASFESCYEVHDDVDEELLVSEISPPTFTDFDAADAHISIGQRELSASGGEGGGELRRAQSTFSYTVDSDSGASPTHAGQNPAPGRPNWQVTILPVSDKYKHTYGDGKNNDDMGSDNNLDENFIEAPPRAQIPRIAGSLPGLLRTVQDEQTVNETEPKIQQISVVDMRDVLRKSIRKIRR